MREKMEMVRRIAAARASILVIGEAGVGKELIAEQIHCNSGRADAPFIRINCAGKNLETIPYQEGATLFFDEVSLLPPRLQHDLLDRLAADADNKEMDGGIRVIASTREDLEKEVNNGRFISELYYQLGVLPLYIPPLRQRTEDIPPLARFFLELYTQKIKRFFDGFTPEALSALSAASWRGNVRELKNCVERAVFSAQGPLIDEDALSFHQKTGYIKREGEGRWDLKSALDGYKTVFLTEVLEEHRWNQTTSARALGIQRTYLSKLIKDLQIQKKAE